MAANGCWAWIKKWLAGAFIPQGVGKHWPWGRVLLAWSLIAFGVLLAGGVAFRAQAMLRYPPATVDFGWATFWGPLLLFSAGGGLTIGLLILTWWLVTGLGFSWTLGFLVLGIVLFALFVWPTRYAYDRSDGDCRLLKVERLTGKSECIIQKS